MSTETIFEIAIDTPAARAERRKAMRYRCYTDLSVLYDGIGRHIDIRPPDISARGMFINTPQEFPIGAALTIRFRLGNSGKMLQVRGEVRYCLAGVGIGVEFNDVSDEVRAALESGCDALDW